MTRRYLTTALGLACVLFTSTVAANVVLDPFGFFGFTFGATARKIAYDERGFKVNYLLHAAPRYDGILLGSSRTTYIPADAFSSGRFFNLAAPNMYPREYTGYVEIARRTQPIATVIIGADFFVSNLHEPYGFPPPGHYLRQANFKTLATLGGFGPNLTTLRCSLRHDCAEDYYDANFIKHMRPRTARQKTENIAAQLALFGRDFYGAGYAWNPRVGAELAALRRENPKLRFVVFTPPIGAPLFALLIQRGRLPEYEHWLRTLVAEFGGVYDFGGYNSITTDLARYVDAHHFTPEVGRLIAGRIEGRTNGIPTDFGVYVTAANLEARIAELRRQSVQGDRDPLATYRRLLAAPQ